MLNHPPLTGRSVRNRLPASSRDGRGGDWAGHIPKEDRLPTEAELRQWMSQQPDYARIGYNPLLHCDQITLLHPPVILFDLTILVRVYAERSAPPVFQAGEEVIIPNGRKGKIHLLMSSGLYRVLYTCEGLRFATPSYYTPQELWALNPEKKKAA